jgi:hypothetical protein
MLVQLFPFKKGPMQRKAPNLNGQSRWATPAVNQLSKLGQNKITC